jgi:hypothetical protein
MLKAPVPSSVVTINMRSPRLVNIQQRTAVSDHSRITSHVSGALSLRIEFLFASHISDDRTVPWLTAGLAWRCVCCTRWYPLSSLARYFTMLDLPLIHTRSGPNSAFLAGRE